MKQKELYKIVIYCRLSLDDGNVVGSVNIHTQKMLLEKHSKMHEFSRKNNLKLSLGKFIR